MLINKPPLFLVVEQELEQPIALGAGHVQDVVRHEPVHEQCFASGIWVCSHDGMRIMRHALTDNRATHGGIVSLGRERQVPSAVSE